VLPIPFRAAEGDSEWLIVAPDDRSASVPVWRSLAAQRPVYFQSGSAYSEQVFWAGLRYDREPLHSLPPVDPEYRDCLYLPDEKAAAANLRKLLCL
jgi:hypothetical protein